jgi:SAM-dependent methyltransferase
MSPYVEVLRGIDVSQTMVDRYNQAAQRSGFSSEQMRAIRGNFVGAESEVEAGDDFRDFDIVVLSMALHHVSNPPMLLSKLVERLRPSGVLVVIDWAPSQQDHHERPHESHEVSKTIHMAHQEFSDDYVAKCFSDAGCSSSSFRYVIHNEICFMPESITKVKGGVRRKVFLASGNRQSGAR